MGLYNLWRAAGGILDDVSAAACHAQKSLMQEFQLSALQV